MKDNELITRKNIELSLLNKGQHSRRYKLGDTWELNYDEIREVLDDADADVQPDITELIAKIKNGISATNTDDVYSCGMRNGMRWVLSLIDGKEPLFESSDKMNFLDFLWNVINPNEMEMYLAMYNRKGVLTDG